MAGRYPDHDWRGIAMLTQQLGQLFEPSKAKMMSQQQEHEMNMLMAKQSWKMQSDDLDALKALYKNRTSWEKGNLDLIDEIGEDNLLELLMKLGFGHS